jgi:superfamily I DNA/RNA helicase
VSRNDGQREAITEAIDASTNVVAGAGTGKTKVLAERYLKLVRDDGVPPHRILTLTFTLAAAAEMRHRIHALVAEHIPEQAADMHGAWIMNFHQFGLRLIRENAPAFGIDPDVGVLTPLEFHRVKRLLRRHFDEGRISGIDADFGGSPPPPTKLESRFDLWFEVAKQCRDHMIDVDDLRAWCREDDTPPYLAIVEAVIGIGRAFEEELRRRNVLDFSDMITIPARHLLSDARLARRYQTRFAHILVDEFQDTSEAQFELLRLLSGGDFARVTVVGDEKQSIYRWRDARVENIREFPGRRRPLGVNYRSQQHILDLAFGLIARDETFADRAEEHRLEANDGPGEHPIVLFHPEADTDHGIEVKALAAWIRALVGEAAAPDYPQPSAPLAYHDVAVLLRRLKGAGVLPYLEEEFARRGIPYAVVGGANAAETRALEAWCGLLDFLVPHGDGSEIRLLHVLEREPFSLPDRALYELFYRDRDEDRPADWLADKRLQVLGDPIAQRRLRTLREVRDVLARRWKEMDFREFVGEALAQSPAYLQLFDEDLSVNAAQDLQREIDTVLDTLEARDEMNLPALLESIRTAIEERRFREEGDLRLPDGRVRVMTQHQAKGLEFPAVAVPGVYVDKTRAERFRVVRDHGLYLSGEDAKEWNRHLEHAPDRSDENRMDRLEERCILYVAVTRAKRFLWVSSPAPEGRKWNKNAPKDSLFTELLDAARDVAPLVVSRAAPATPDRAAIAAGGAAARTEAITGAIASRERVRVARSAGGVGTSATALHFVTWGALYDFQSCPLRYRFAHLAAPDAGVAMGPKPEGPEAIPAAAVPEGLAAATYGVLVHEALRSLAETPEGDDDARLAAICERFGVTGSARAATIAAARPLLRAARGAGMHETGADARFEAPFEVRGGSVVVHGVFDRVERVEGGWRVRDYKVGASDPAHAFQLACYAWALGRITGEGVTGEVCYVREEGVHARPAAGPDAIAAVASLVEALEGALSANRFEATPGPACAACSHRDVCRYAEVAPRSG